MSYMEKKTNKRQTTIISLSDYNAKEIQDIRDAKAKLLADFEEKKNGEWCVKYSILSYFIIICSEWSQ